MYGLTKLLRIRHWVKNLFLLIPVFFAGELFSMRNFSTLFWGLIAFSLIASSIYIINDYRDIESDRRHPQKRSRPLASGEISIKTAGITVVFLLAFSLIISWKLNVAFFTIICIYFLINLAYSFGLKHISILDIFIVASGFLLRVIAGGMLADVVISQWLIIMVFLLALFLALAKRRDDILMNKESGAVIRKSTQNYNLDFANSCLTMLSSVIMVAYIMYTISDEVTERLNSDSVYITSIFVVAGIMRYLQIALVENNSGSPTKILYSDLFIKITLIGWILCFYVIIYLHKF